MNIYVTHFYILRYLFWKKNKDTALYTLKLKYLKGCYNVKVSKKKKKQTEKNILIKHIFSPHWSV